MLVVATANNKGGVGKTTLSVNLAVGFAQREFSGHKPRVLLVDLDGQAQSTKWLAPHFSGDAEAVPTAFAALTTGKVEGAILPASKHERVFVLPATDDLLSADLDLARAIGGTGLLAKALRPLEDVIDVIIIDCPPSLGLTVAAALCASDAVISPVFASDLALQGLARMEEAITQVRERLNASVQMLGYVLVGADSRERITAEARKMLSENAPHPLFKSEVRLSTAAKSLQSRGLTVFDPKADQRGAEDYPALIEEIASKLLPTTTVASATAA